ncbi:response regulator [Fusibacter ferrireducens]|uniref:Stage 0 sporulation protein A homolog n=1 Tax=Fusibacter ferrireducens TaxID=2785058 RepID=A0ABR9ZWH7_9FIRM|nr:response regulator [Fusibacter ferrireducens]MBF4694796.1 response regulator [Fusibacter ferrireducens]
MNILIVDDSKMNIKIAEDTLLENHVVKEIITALSGEEAIDILEKNTVDLVLLDIIMPGLSGIDLLKIFNERHWIRDIKVIMLTTVDDFLVLKECFELGATDYIQKPFNKIEFTSRVRSVLKEIENDKKLLRALNLLEKQNLELIHVNQVLKDTQSYIIEKEKMVAVGELLSGLTNEISLPLGHIEDELLCVSGIVKSCNVASEEKLNNAKQKIDATVMSCELNIDKIKKLVASLSNITRDNSKDDYENIKLNDLIDEVLFILNYELKSIKKVTKKYRCDAEVYCNKAQLKQAVMHIILNAINVLKDQNESLIEISTLENERHVLCFIKDNGPGIENDVLSKIFDPFFTTKSMDQHTGLGLSIAQDIIVNKHKGQISVETEVGNGSTFVIVLNRGNL